MHNLPPLRTPMYVEGTMHPAWWKYFSALHAFTTASGASTGVDDTDPPDQPTEAGIDNAIQLSILLAMFAERNAELEKIVDLISYAAPKLGYTPINSLGDTMHGTLTMFPSSTDRPAMRFKSGTLQTSPQAGDLEYVDGHWYITNGARHAISTTAGIKTSTTTVENTTVETTVCSYTFAAGELHADEHITVQSSGVYSNASAADDFTIRIKLGGTTLHTISRVGGNVTDAGMLMNYTFTIRTDGASGTFVDIVQLFDQNNIYTATEGTEHSIDTTVSNLFEVTFQWDSAKAGNIAKCTQGKFQFDH